MPNAALEQAPLLCWLMYQTVLADANSDHASHWLLVDQKMSTQVFCLI
jgi:hypothetical protein